MVKIWQAAVALAHLDRGRPRELLARVETGARDEQRRRRVVQRLGRSRARTVEGGRGKVVVVF